MKSKRIEPGPGQESVWDYPRPPRLEICEGISVKVIADDIVIANTTSARRILETSHPPTYYIPLTDTRIDMLVDSPNRTWCEWKGEAHYFNLLLPKRTISNVGWVYPNPSKKYPELKHTIAFYPSKVCSCFVGDDKVLSQEGDFYGGWITPKIVGPFKGAPGTSGW